MARRKSLAAGWMNSEAESGKALESQIPAQNIGTPAALQGKNIIPPLETPMQDAGAAAVLQYKNESQTVEKPSQPAAASTSRKKKDKAEEGSRNLNVRLSPSLYNDFTIYCKVVECSDMSKEIISYIQKCIERNRAEIDRFKSKRG